MPSQKATSRKVPIDDGSGAALVRRCANRRDAATWDEFLGRFEGSLRSGIQRALRRAWRENEGVNGRDRDDLLQDVLCRLLENDGSRLRNCRAGGDREASVYLARVAESAVLDILRAAGAEKRGGDVTTAIEAAAAHELEPAIDSGPTPEQRVLVRERRTRFFRACRDVVGSGAPRRDMKVVYLAFAEGWKSRDIARHCSLSVAAVDSLIYRVRHRLRRRGIRVPRRRAGAL